MGEKNYTAKGAKYGFFFDQTLCTGCKACQIACIDKHDLPTGVRWRRVVEYSGGTWQISGGHFQPLSLHLLHVSLMQPLRGPDLHESLPYHGNVPPR